MDQLHTPSRRKFFGFSIASLSLAFFPKNSFGRKTETSCWFLRINTGESWRVRDPIEWCIENINHPMLKRASKRIENLFRRDGDRIIRLVTRRCGLNLIEVAQEKTVVSYWGLSGLADMRPFFKKHQLGRNDVQVILKNRKKETVSSHSGEDFLFGEKLAADWPLELYLLKWQCRFMNHSHDWTAAPGTHSGYAWVGLEPDQIPWVALKSAWRRGNAIRCQNCDRPTILVNFGEPWTALFRRSPKFIYVCRICRRTYQDHSIKDPCDWMIANLSSNVYPDFKMSWDQKLPISWS